MLASAESMVSENEAAAELPGTVDLTVHVDVTVITQVMCRALAPCTRSTCPHCAAAPQTSPERIWMIEPIAERWEGHISLALFLPENFKEKTLKPFRQWHATVKARVVISEVRCAANNRL